jgi:hypothetical protein
MLSADPVIQEPGWRLVTQRRVQPLPVVEHLDVLEAGRRHLAARREADTMHSLVLEAVEPALGRGVVPAVALAAHRTGHAVFGKLALKGMTGILAASIGVMQYARRRLSPEPRHGQRVRHDIRRHARLQRPANDFTVDQVEHDRQVEPTFIGLRVGDIRVQT